jgi:hypothetical protein
MLPPQVFGLMDIFISNRYGTGCHSRLNPYSCWGFDHIAQTLSRLLARSPTLRSSCYKCHLRAVNRCRASHVSSYRRCNAPLPSVLLARHTPLSGLPRHFHPARFQSRWCTHKPTSIGMARLSVTAHHNLPHSILKGCRYRLKLSSDLPGLRPEVPTSPDFSSTP